MQYDIRLFEPNNSPLYNYFYDILHVCIYALLFVTGRSGGLVVERRTSERELGGSIPTQVAVLYS